MTTAQISPVSASTSSWQIDPVHTQVEFGVRHLMISTVRGRFSDVAGTLTVPGGDFTRAVLDVSIGVASVDTREPQRDGHLRSADFLHAENHPYLTFVSTRVEPKGQNEFTVYGDLTIRGVTRPVALEGEFLGTNKSPYGFQVAGFSAKTKLNRKDYGLNWNAALETGGLLVGVEAKISIEIEAIQQA